MTGPSSKLAPTVADYRAAESCLQEVRDAAAEGFRAAQERGDADAGDQWRSTLERVLDEFRSFRAGLPESVRLSINADRILDTFSIDDKGFVKLVIPPDISDEDAMHVLNRRFRELFPEKERGAIYENQIDEIINAGGERARRTKVPQSVTILAVVPGTTNMTRPQQEAELQRVGLTLSHPIEQALAAAAYACKHDGADLFQNLFVRSSSLKISLLTFTTDGVGICTDVDLECPTAAVSGSPSPE